MASESHTPTMSCHSAATEINQTAPHFDMADRLNVMGVFGKSAAGRQIELQSEGKPSDTIIDFVRCSYLGLDNHPDIVESSIFAIERYRSVHWSCARTGLNFHLLHDLEEVLSELFMGRVVAFSSIILANLSALPLIASGILTDDVKPVMVFDRLCHDSLAYHKAAVADETQVMTIDHNDIAALEAICETNPCVAYIGDSLYPMGNEAPVKELVRLQEKYNLFLYIHDAHGISISGDHGEGYCRSQLPARLGARSIIAASLGKGFGASGGILLLGTKHQEDLFRRHAQPWASSTVPNIAAIGAALASAKIHASPELGQLQGKLAQRLDAFDNQIWTQQQHSQLPIRTVHIGNEEEAILAAKMLMEKGVYAAAVFFPTVPRGAAGLRVCITATHSLEDISQLCSLIGDVHRWREFDPPSVSTTRTY